MEYNFKTKAYLKEMEAVLIESKYKVFQIDFVNMQAFVNKQDTYKKRNGKICHVTHHFGRWIKFDKKDISYGSTEYTSYTSSFYGLEESKGKKTVKYLRPEVKKRLVSEYHLL